MLTEISIYLTDYILLASFFFWPEYYTEAPLERVRACVRALPARARFSLPVGWERERERIKLWLHRVAQRR